MKTNHTSFLIFLALIFSIPFSYSQTASIDYSNGKVRLSSTPPLVGSLVKSPFWRVYMWEFGDGNYSYEIADDKNDERLFTNHLYENKEDRNLQLHLTPVYSTSRAKTLTTNISRNKIATGRSNQKYKIIKPGKQVGIFTNSFWDKKFDKDPKIVPGHDVQVVVHYKIPNDGGGYLVFFYDDELIEDISSSDVRTYFSEQKMGVNDFEQSLSNRHANAKLLFGKLDRSFNNSNIIFDCNNLEAGKEQRLFLTMKMRDDISEDIIDENESTKITAMWIPKFGDFEESTNVVSYPMDIVSYHDPNRIRVKPKRLLYRKGFPKELNYRVSFENIGEGVVGDIKIEVELDEDVDLHTFKINRVSPIGLQQCPVGVVRDENTQCYTVEKIPTTKKNKLIFTIYNSGLLGEEERRKYRKGFMDFVVRTNNKRKKNTYASANIIFGNNKPVKTFPARTKWRMKTLHLKAGINLTEEVLDFDIENIDPLDVMSVGLYFQNAPMGSGFSHSVDISLTGSRFSRDSNYVLQPSNFLPTGGYMSLQEDSAIKFIEAQYQLGYQFGGGLRIFGGVGASTIAFGELDIDANITETNSLETIVVANELARFGLFEDKELPTVFNQPIEPVNGVGLISSVGVEIGALNFFTIGASNQFRYYPKFYHGNCNASFNLNAYIRFKFSTLGSRG